MSGRGAFHFSEITLTQIYAVYVVGSTVCDPGVGYRLEVRARAMTPAAAGEST